MSGEVSVNPTGSSNPRREIVSTSDVFTASQMAAVLSRAVASSKRPDEVADGLGLRAHVRPPEALTGSSNMSGSPGKLKVNARATCS